MLISGEVFHSFRQNLKGVTDPERAENPCLRLLVVTNPLSSTPIYTFLLRTRELMLPGDKS